MQLTKTNDFLLPFPLLNTCSFRGSLLAVSCFSLRRNAYSIATISPVVDEKTKKNQSRKSDSAFKNVKNRFYYDACNFFSLSVNNFSTRKYQTPIEKRRESYFFFFFRTIRDPFGAPSIRLKTL